MQLRTIDIDFDIHQRIEAERQSFDEPPYIALRRLLGLPALTKQAEVKQAPETGRPFVEDGVTIPHGSEARMEYQRGKQVYEGSFLDGMLVVNGKEYPSLSSAAKAVAVTKDGKRPSLNGWLYWKARFSGETQWRSLQDMREECRKLGRES
ncbi:hypothetical protein [uncultured Roseibium sp.]|uniref:hypothetical protein n=1 Tax=uncultured Roseibium sp. TaxID=1936171 RepID=UPI002602AFCC|nr:hypothetical protein [uncultured Roseibium sp.]